jgi:CubicO group peptidase (beta-lactamase class C family)
MASGVDCGDEYEDRQSCYYRYSSSIGEGFRPAGSPDNPYDYVASIPKNQRWAEPGTGYQYSGVDTFVLGWLVERLTGLPFQAAFSREVWRHLGAEHDARIWAGRYGIPLTSGGFMSTVRDLGRFGLLFTPSYGIVAERRVISPRYLDLIVEGGRGELLDNARGGGNRGEGVLHNVYQWDTVWDNGDFMKGGWAGQGLMINADKDLVAVWTGYYDADWNEVSILPMLRAIWADLYPSPPGGVERGQH